VAIAISFFEISIIIRSKSMSSWIIFEIIH